MRLTIKDLDKEYEKTEEKKYDRRDIGDYRFIVGNSYLSYDNKLSYWKNLLIKSYYNLKLVGVQEGVNYGLDESNVIYEKYPLVYEPINTYPMERIAKHTKEES